MHTLSTAAACMTAAQRLMTAQQLSLHMKGQTQLRSSVRNPALHPGQKITFLLNYLNDFVIYFDYGDSLSHTDDSDV